MIHCQLQNKAYENDVPDAHIVPHSGEKKNTPIDDIISGILLFIVYNNSFQLYFSQTQKVI